MARPIGVGALCSGCGDRRTVHLRYFELETKERTAGGRWIVLCHNCTAVAHKMKPQPRSIEGLKMRLQRDRRWGDRRAASVGGKSERDSGFDRRDDDRRLGLRDLYDATDLAEELVIEMEADYEDQDQPRTIDPADMTGIHYRPSLEEITRITCLASILPPEGAEEPLLPEGELLLDKSGDEPPVVEMEAAHATIEEALASTIADNEIVEEQATAASS